MNDNNFEIETAVNIIIENNIVMEFGNLTAINDNNERITNPRDVERYIILNNSHLNYEKLARIIRIIKKLCPDVRYNSDLGYGEDKDVTIEAIKEAVKEFENEARHIIYSAR